MARARAAPSAGSVPVPISSMRTSEWASAPRTISARLARWAEKVDRLWAMDCSSPMSAKKAVKTGITVPGPTGGTTPHWASAATSPVAFRKTLLPPVLGPETTRARSPSHTSRSKGTTGASEVSRRRGWRAWRSRNAPAPAGANSGTDALHASAVRARATSVSRSTRASRAPTSSMRDGARRAVRSPRMRRTSRASSRSRSRIWLISSMAMGGSTKRVAPVWDSSWTMPPTSPFPSLRTGMTYRPSRMVTEASGTTNRSGRFRR